MSSGITSFRVLQNGIRFYKVIWYTPTGKQGYHETIEPATSRRNLSNKIARGDLIYKFDGCEEIAQPIKIQEIETPVIEVSWLLNMFSTGGTKAEREAHRQQAAYVLHLVETCAARVMKEDGTIIER